MHMLSLLLNYLSRRKELKVLRKAKAEAQYLAEKHNQRFYVLPDWNGTPRPMTRDKIKWLKKRGILAKAVSIYHLEKEALFIADPPIVKRKEINLS